MKALKCISAIAFVFFVMCVILADMGFNQPLTWLEGLVR